MPFALFNYARIDDRHAAQADLDDNVLPRVKEHVVGLVRAYYTVDDAATNSVAVLVFDTRDEAEAMAERLRSGEAHPSPGVTFERCEVSAELITDASCLPALTTRATQSGRRTERSSCGMPPSSLESRTNGGADPAHFGHSTG
jgi:hypothetical protein